MTQPARTAVTDAPLHPLLAERWSPRALDAGHALTPEQTRLLLEAARWAPSAANTQPWRFLVAQRGTPEAEALFGVLAPGNQLWAASASALVLVAAQVQAPDGSPRPWAAYDTGQAVAHLSVQAQAEGLSVHQLGGFDAATAAEVLDLDATLQPLVVLAVGVHDAGAALPAPLAEREVAPRERLPLDALLLPVPADLQRADRAAA